MYSKTLEFALCLCTHICNAPKIYIKTCVLKADDRREMKQMKGRIYFRQRTTKTWLIWKKSFYNFIWLIVYFNHTERRINIDFIVLHIPNANCMSVLYWKKENSVKEKIEQSFSISLFKSSKSKFCLCTFRSAFYFAMLFVTY